MISVLIPVHNYSTLTLVEELYKQLKERKTIFEIIVWDDASTEAFTLQNKVVNHLPEVHYLKSNVYYGRTQSLKSLYDRSLFDWLLFIDPDVMPKYAEYIQNYLNLIPKNYDVVYGGISYIKEAPKKSMLLRWTYGRSQDIDATIRNQKPYKTISSGNLMIKRNVFSSINSEIKDLGNASDAYFAKLLKAHEFNVFHTNNEVYHLGIESNKHFISETKETIDTLVKLYKEDKITADDNSLLDTYLSLKKFMLNGLVGTIYKRSHQKMERNLTEKDPSMKLLQLYKISYMCYMLNKKT